MGLKVGLAMSTYDTRTVGVAGCKRPETSLRCSGIVARHKPSVRQE